MSKPDINWTCTPEQYRAAYLALQDILAYVESPMTERFSAEEIKKHVAKLARKGLPAEGEKAQ